MTALELGQEGLDLGFLGRGEGLSPEPDPVVKFEELIDPGERFAVVRLQLLGELPRGHLGVFDEAPFGQKLQGPFIERHAGEAVPKAAEAGPPWGPEEESEGEQDDPNP